MKAGEDVQRFRRPSTRELVALIIVATLLLAAAVSGALALSRDVFSASGFVSSYMDALIRRDAASAASMPGVLPENADKTKFLDSPNSVLLTSNALAKQNSQSSFRIVSDVVLPDASDSPIHRVTVSTSLADKDILFSVRETGSFAGLFATWEFATSPLAHLTVTTEHATFFEINGYGPIDMVSVDKSLSTNAFTASHSFPVLAPGSFELGIDSLAIKSEKAVVDVLPGEDADVTITASPTADFNARVQKEVDSYFDTCVEQRVLMPSGCVFGISIQNRIVGEPTWGITSYPVVSLVAGETGWEISPAAMAVTFDGEIQSLFDGSVTSVHQDIPITVGGTVGLSASGDIAVLIRRIDFPLT